MENGLQVSLAVVKTSGKISYGLDCPFSSKSFGILKTNIKNRQIIESYEDQKKSHETHSVG